MKKDNSRITVEKTLSQIRNTKKLMSQRYEFGPDKVHMSNREARIMIQNMDQDSRDRMFSTMGTESWNLMMEKLYNG
jgi:hypothetical protein|tara:strand:- start:58 stop:288 length:231 start_codon:yes stop_codon:yes gene_type:complete